MEGLSLEVLGIGGAVAALVLAFVLWKLFKLALKVVVFVVGAALIAAVVALWVTGGRATLPTERAAPALPAPAAPR